MKSLSIALTTLFFVSLGFAQEKKVNPEKLKHPVKACLFKVEGNGLTKPCWLFGTIHLGQKNIVNLHPNAKAAFKQTDAVYTEVDMDPKSQMALLPLLMRKDGQKLSQAIGPKLTKRVNEELAHINPQLNIAAFDGMKTWVIAATLPLLELQLSGEQPLDMVLYLNAKNKGKTVGALETGASQANVFDQFNEEEINNMLVDTLKSMKEDRENGTNSTRELLNMYLTEDVHTIGKYVSTEMEKMEADEDFKKRFMEALIDKRNIGMADKAHEFMQATPEDSHFFAVGAAHYTGKLAVQDLLEKKGYTITETFE